MEVVKISKNADTALRLRELADRIDESGVSNVRVTAVVNGKDVYCWGPVADDKAAEGAVFDLTYGIHLLMSRPVQVANEEGMS